MALIFARNKIKPITQPVAGSIWTRTEFTTEITSVADQIKLVKTPEPTATHRPIPHSLLVDKTRTAFDNAGFEILEEEHALARGGQQYFGGFALTGENIQSKDRRLVFGLRNSHDKTTASSACMGNSMMVCDNMCFSSDVKLARRHTSNILRDLDQMLSKAIERVVHSWVDMGQRIEAYKGRSLSNPSASDLTANLASLDVIPGRDVYNVIKEFRDPQHPEFRGKTLWNLYNSVTENLKGGDFSKLPKRTMTMQRIFDNVAKFKAPSVVEAEEVVLAS
jgi:hypothetical protein